METRSDRGVRRFASRKGCYGLVANGSSRGAQGSLTKSMTMRFGFADLRTENVEEWDDSARVIDFLI
jgi:hypothetical protein